MFGRGRKQELERLAEEQGLGAVERSVELDEAGILQTDAGLWLLEPGEEPRDLGGAGVFSLDSTLGRDRLTTDNRTFFAPVGGSGRLRKAIAFGRLAALGPRGPELPDDPFVQSAFAVEDEWLRRSLGEGEQVLAWLETASVHRFSGPIVRSLDAPLRYLLTDARAQLVAVSDVGDVHAVDLPLHALAVTELVGRDTVISGEQRWKTTLTNASLYRTLAPLQARSGADRVVAMAALRGTATRGRSKATARAQALLDSAIAGGDEGLARLGRAWLEVRTAEAAPSELVDAAGDAVDRVLARGADRLVAWAAAWGLDPEEQGALVAALRARRPGSAALVPLHRAAWSARTATADGATAARLHRDLAEHLLAAGRADEAAALADRALAALSPTSIDDLVVPSDGEDEGLHAAHAIRIDLIELSATARGVRDLATIGELARLQPLELPRVRALVDAAEGDLGERADVALHLLEELGTAGAFEDRRLRPLKPALLADVLPHPAVRGGGGVDPVQRWLAREAEAPDYGAITEFAERIDVASHPDVAAALQDASLVLGQDAPLEAYVSRGARPLGVRVCEGPPPFLLLGVDHLGEGPWSFGPAELRFAVAAEVAHLRLGHARLTAASVWDKVFDEAPTFLATLADLAPFIPVRGAAIAKGLQLARLVPLGRFRPPGRRSAGDLAIAWGDLLMACRAMQLTADRAGLLVCGDLRAAVRAMLVTTPAGREAWGRAERHGLRWALHTQDEDGEPVPTQLALRVAALFAFWLSDEYPQLRDAIQG